MWLRWLVKLASGNSPSSSRRYFRPGGVVAPEHPTMSSLTEADSKVALPPGHRTEWQSPSNRPSVRDWSGA